MPLLPKPMREQLTQRGCKKVPRVSDAALLRVKELGHTVVHQIMSGAMEQLRSGRRKTLSLDHVIAATQDFLAVYPWVNQVRFVDAVRSHMFVESSAGKRRINTMGMVRVGEVEQMLKTTRKAPREANAFACRAADEFVCGLVFKAATLTGFPATLDAGDIDTALLLSPPTAAPLP